MSTQPAKSSASSASRNALDPLALVRSPIARNAVSWRNGTWLYSDATPGSGRGDRASRRVRPAGAAVTPRRSTSVGDVLGGGAAAAADEGQAELDGEPLVRVGELGRRQRVVGAVGGELGQPGVRLARDRDRRVRGQVPQVLAHQVGSGRAVEADHVDAKRRQGGERRADLRAEQHGAGGLDGQRRDDDRVRRQVGHRAPGADDRRLRLEQVRAGLDDQRVGAAAQQPRRVLVVGVAQLAERDVAERGQLGARADRAEHPAGPPVRRGELVRDGAGDRRAGVRQLADAPGYPVLAEVAEVRAERVRGDAVSARRQVGAVDAAHHVRPGDVQHLVAAVVAVEVLGCHVARLEHRPHGAVRDDDALGERCRAVRRNAQ